jgi:hypothetical protein
LPQLLVIGLEINTGIKDMRFVMDRYYSGPVKGIFGTVKKGRAAC